MAGSTLNIIPSDKASIYSVLTAAQTLALVRPANPPPGLAGFLFDIDDDDIVKLRSQVSRHFVEDNTTIQDQVALEPEGVVLRRFVGELVYANPSVAPVSATPDPLPLNPGMVPAITPGALQDQIAAQVQSAAENKAVSDQQSLWGFYVGQGGETPNQTRQSIVFGYLYQLWLGRCLFTVETPWGVFTNMVIESADFEQAGISKSSSEATITFQKIRVAQPATVTVGQVANRAQIQQAPVTQNGSAGTTPVTPAQQSSILQQILYPPNS